MLLIRGVAALLAKTARKVQLSGGPHFYSLRANQILIEILNRLRNLKNDKAMGKLIRAAYSLILAIPLLSGCTDDAKLRLCERESRVIPDVELKGRLLLGIRKRGGSWGKLPDDIEKYLVTRMPENASDMKIQTILSQYITENPFCCQFDHQLNEIYKYEPNFNDSRDKGSNYFANINFYRKKGNGSLEHMISGRSAAFSCGEVVVFNYG